MDRIVQQDKIKRFIDKLIESGEAPYLNLTDPRVVKHIHIVWMEAYHDGFCDGREMAYENYDSDVDYWKGGWGVDGQN